MKEKVLKSTTNSIITLSPNILSSLSRIAQSDKSIHRQKKEPINCPENPYWVQEHQFLSWDFYENPEKFESELKTNDHHSLSQSVQENMIIEDLLNCMCGIEGKLIKTQGLIDIHAERTFHIDRSLDPAMRDLARRILPVCVNYSVIVRFVEEKSNFKWGLVNHALCSAIKELIKNHYVFVCQLESLHRNGELSLQKMWYYVDPIMAFMEVLAKIIKTINKGDCCGSSVIDLLYEKVQSYSGDQKLQELIHYLAQTASKPYLSMLEDWIYKGQINDPYHEFMITEDKEITKEKLQEDFNEKFWEKKYSINRNSIPKFLENISERILLTGKYLNAINETDQSRLGIDSKLVIPNTIEIIFSIKDEAYKQIVENAYLYSSKILLNLLLKEHKLIDRLRSLKHYFLHDQSDYLVHFMDISEEEMQKERDDIKLSRLESLLELSLRITSANSDPYKDDLRVKLLKTDLKTMVLTIQNIETQNETKMETQAVETKLNGLASFSLDYVVKWPLSLIINKRTLFKYQVLFRHVYLIKDVERKLCNVWICTKSGELCLDRNYKYYSIACALKQRMLNFVQNLLNYMTFEVFESSWISFEEKLKEVSNIDDVINYHGSFLDSCLRDCIIQSKSFLNIQKILSVCNMFSSYLQGLTLSSKKKEEATRLFDQKVGFKVSQEKRNTTMQEIKADLDKIINGELFAKAITDYNNQFTQLLLDLLSKISNEMGTGLGETKIQYVLYRLDFNNHYREQLEKMHN
jgi:gamma-tubulin complex component 2